MRPFEVLPGEIITGFGCDFAEHFIDGETIAAATVLADTGINADTVETSGTIATATLTIVADTPPSLLSVIISATGTAGSLRKVTRTILVK